MLYRIHIQTVHLAPEACDPAKPDYKLHIPLLVDYSNLLIHVVFVIYVDNWCLYHLSIDLCILSATEELTNRRQKSREYWCIIDQ